MRYDRCTSVQADAIPAMLTGADIVCKAKTGTGKTLAFLIPAIEALIRAPVPRGSIGVLVLSPARELALQIEAEAKQLTRFQNLKTQVRAASLAEGGCLLTCLWHGCCRACHCDQPCRCPVISTCKNGYCWSLSSICYCKTVYVRLQSATVLGLLPPAGQAIVGGTSMHRDLQALKRAAPDVLIATPGRLNDHLQNEGLAGAMQHLRLLVFDEADRLLDMGFRWALPHAGQARRGVGCCRLIPAAFTHSAVALPNSLKVEPVCVNGR